MSGELRTICLNDIAGFTYLYARMPTAEETERQHIPAGVPVLVMHFGGADLPTGRVMPREQTYRADVVAFTIDTRPAPDAGGDRAEARYVIHQAIEDITNAADDLGRLAVALGGTPGDVRRVADRVREERAAEWGDSLLVMPPESGGPDGT